MPCLISSRQSYEVMVSAAQHNRKDWLFWHVRKTYSWKEILLKYLTWEGIQEIRYRFRWLANKNIYYLKLHTHNFNTNDNSVSWVCRSGQPHLRRLSSSSFNSHEFFTTLLSVDPSSLKWRQDREALRWLICITWNLNEQLYRKKKNYLKYCGAMYSYRSLAKYNFHISRI